MVTVSTTEEHPAPYSDCQNVDQPQNEDLSFYAKDYEYTHTQCLLSCLQAHFMYRYDDLISSDEFQESIKGYVDVGYYDDDDNINATIHFEGIPCNPLNKSSAFGFPLRCHDTVPYGDLWLPMQIYRKWDVYRNETDACYDKCPKSCFSTAYSIEASRKWEKESQILMESDFFPVYFVPKVQHLQSEPVSDVYSLAASLGGVLGEGCFAFLDCCFLLFRTKLLR